MKFGSVRFFKVVIVAVVALAIVVPTAFAVVLGALYAGQKNRVAELEGVNRILVQDFIAAVDSMPQNISPEMAALVEAGAPAPSFAYQGLYPHLYAELPAERVAKPRVCYLTFDDGPSPVTRQVLEILARYDVKATFFVTGRASEVYEETLAAAAEAGHTVGVHTYSHDYAEIYASAESYLADFERMYTRIAEVTGRPPTIFRFAGGSINVYNRFTYPQIIAEMTRRGFVYYDWNAAGGDAVAGGLTRTQIVENVLASAADKDRLIVLLHDRSDNATTAAALPAIIEGLAAQGYTFEALQSEVEPITYFYPDDK